MPAPGPYVPQTWTNSATTPLSATRLAVIESAIFKASLARDGVVNFDEYTGTDDQKWVAAWGDLRNSTRKYTLQLPARTFSVSTSQALFSGAAMIGPDGPDATKNLEIGGGNLVPHRLVWQGGSGTSSCFTNTGTSNQVNFASFAWQSGGSGQFLHSVLGSNMYPARFDALTIYGGNGGFGSRTAGKFLGTQCTFSGHWTVLGYMDTPFRIGGGDMKFEWYLNSNSPSNDASHPSYAGKPIFWADGLGKTALHYPYLTNENGTVGLLVTGGGRDKDLNIFSGIYEGRNSGVLSAYPVIDVQSGVVNLFGGRFAHVDDGNTTTAPGVIKVSGDGVLNLFGGVYERQSASIASTFPLIYQADGATGAVSVHDLVSSTGESIYIRRAGGTTTTIAPPVNRVNGLPMAAPAVTGSRIGTAALNDLLAELAAGGYITNSTTGTVPSVTGSRSDGTALASLITQLAALGFISDSTSA
jgi:hypothetical protein